ncbi:MAG: copper amine oxidase N-terminal domain-containing protein [Anaerovorax sp.]|nr:copper amine oxidase N-terminal domain-containing protein [Anaerovorax sp.]
MKKGIIILCMLMVVALSMTELAFANTAVSDVNVDTKKISSEMEQFLYGDWKIQTFLGYQPLTKDVTSYSGGEILLGKVVSIFPNIFSTEDFAQEYEMYAVDIWTRQYNLIDNLTGKEFTTKYRISENKTKIKDTDQVQLIQPVPEDENSISIQPVLVAINNERLLLCLNGNYFELGKNIWSKNDMVVAIYEPSFSKDGNYHVVYHNNEAELISESDQIQFLMVNGGFVPYPDIKVVNGRTLVPLRTVSELLDAQVDWNEKNKTIAITGVDIKIHLTINSTKADINDVVKTLDAPPFISDGKTYVPVRFIAEALSADVGYVSNLNADSALEASDGTGKAERNICVITIEKPDKNISVYSIDEGLAKVKEASVEEYKLLLEMNKNIPVFTSYQKDYDANDIVYTNQTCGRYYIYRLAAFPGFNIFFNKYTGEIYSECASLPFFDIDKGFINISWIYQ